MPASTATNKLSNLPNTPNVNPDVNILYPSQNTIAAAGSTQATATAVGTDRPFVFISNNTAANGVILPTASFGGQAIIIYPQLVTNAPLVYPPVGGAINYGTVNAGVASTARKAVTYIAVDDGTGLNYVTQGL